MPEQAPVLRPGEGVYGEATITFSAQIPVPVQTKAMGDEPFMTDENGNIVKGDLQTMHLVVFDENGMLVETREAKILTPINGTHDTGRYDKGTQVILPEAKFEVTLTVTDQPRIIHFIANCPVDQIAYGHESSIIGNMYVTKAEYTGEGKTARETAYWARVEVPYILVEEKRNAGGEFLGYIPHNTIIDKFQCIPMIRNYAQIVVRNSTSNFKLEGFAIYNTIDRGTVAPYNEKIPGFQSFTFGTTNNEKFSYPELSNPSLTNGALLHPYEGHALASATLNTQLSSFLTSYNTDEIVLDADGNQITDANGNPVKYQECYPFYMYERKVSARTDQEEMWKESPPHIIIKGKYGTSTTSTYYKADLIYSKTSADGISSNHYYNILRNFRYQFTIVRVSGDGYASPEEAIAGAPSNNLSSSTTTTKFTNISDEDGRLWVSYTDTTLVNDNTISLMYKYVPDLSVVDSKGEPVINNNVITTQGGVGVKLDGLLDGEVISGYTVADEDITEGPWAGYREVTLTINDPAAVNKNQTLVVRTNNPSLSRDVRYTLKQPYSLAVSCTEQVPASLGQQVQVDIKLPIGLTDDMFPLELDIEVYDMTLSPDAVRNTKQLPVKTGPSVIPSKNGQNTFHYVLTIETKAEYDLIPTVDNQKTITTHWLTNISNNASYVYVSNKYFNAAYDYWINTDGQVLENPFAVFKNLKLSPIPTTTGGNVTLSFSYDDSVTTTRESVTMTLVGLKSSGSDSRLTLVSSDASTGTYTYRFTPSDSNLNQEITLQTVSARGDVSVTLQSNSYKPTSRADKTRPYLKFNGSFDQEGPLAPAAHTPVSYTFNVPYAVEEITVTMDGLEPVSSGAVTVEAASTKAAGVPELTGGTSGVYKLKPNGYKGQVTLGLQTSNTSAVSGMVTRSIALSDGGTHYIDDYDEIDQVGKKKYLGNNITVQESRVDRPNSNNNNNTYTATITELTSSSGDIPSYEIESVSFSWGGNQTKGTLTVKFKSFSIEGVNLNTETEITIQVQIKRGNATRTHTITRTIGELELDEQN